jgi:hypothetical protein
MGARLRAHCALVAVSLSENRQIGGGCVGGVTWPYKMPAEKDCGGPSIKCGSGIAAGNIAATKLKHLKAQAMDPLQSSGGQHGVSA